MTVPFDPQVCVVDFHHHNVRSPDEVRRSRSCRLTSD